MVAVEGAGGGGCRGLTKGGTKKKKQPIVNEFREKNQRAHGLGGAAANVQHLSDERANGST